MAGHHYLVGALVICFAGCPIAGWLADVYIGRYQFIRCSLRVTWSGIIATNLCYLIDKFFFKFPSAVATSLHVILAIVVGLGLAGIIANSMQFGLDQLIDASSTDICSYISWGVWLFFLAYSLALFSQHYLCGIYDLPVSFLFVSLTITVVVLSDVACNHWLVKEPVTQNPLKLIYQVLRYAVKNKYPRMRSAFTYWEDKPYTRIDLGKRKYGGPFTTEQVEDVKTFFQLLAILVTSVLISFMMHGQHIIPKNILEHYQGTTTLKLCEEIVHLQQFSSWIQQKLVGNFSNTFIVLLVPALELILYPFQKMYCPRLHMSMLTRLVASIFLMLLSNVSNLTLELVALFGNDKQNATCQFFPLSNNNSNNHKLALNYRWLVIPQIIMSVSQYLFFTSCAEFFVSQCPYAMRGLIIGAAATTYGASSGLYDMSLRIVMWLHNSTVKDTYCGVWYYLAYALASLLMLFVAFIIGKKCYKFRRRDEDVHNRQMFAENYYEKYLPLLS